MTKPTTLRLCCALLLVVLAACAAPPPEVLPGDADSSNDEPQPPSPPPSGAPGELTWLFETAPLPQGRDAADDPAIWVDSDDPSNSLIIGTDKKGRDGLVVYDLSGAELQSTGGTPMNNVDLRPRVSLAGEEQIVVVASSIPNRALEVFILDPVARRLEVAGPEPIETGIRAAGVCLYQAAEDELYVFATAGNGEVQQWRLAAGDGGVTGELVRELRFDSHTEGCVVDDRSGRLYVSEETRGIWMLSADPSAGDDRDVVDSVGGAGRLEADIEGLAIAAYEDGRTFLIASSQGDDRFVAYRVDEGAPAVVGEFAVDGPQSQAEDDVSHTDGLEVTLLPVGPAPFERGMIVVQDDDNEEPGGAEANQNFKAIPWGPVEALLGIR